MIQVNKILDDFFSGYMPSLSSSLRENRLERMRLILASLGNPERSFRAIHIAGSKGKGTTASTLSFFLSSLGFRTGLFLSPHVYDIRERFTLSTVFFKDEEYLSSLEELKKGIEYFAFPPSLGPEAPTTFELYTAYSYILFRNTGCTWAVIETGLGGRLDATNTIIPECSVITRIELEHTMILGSTLPQIAGEKAGIIKKNVPVFVLRQNEEVMDVFRKTASSLISPLYVFNPPLIEVTDGYDIKKIEYLGGEIVMKTFPGDVRLLDALYSLFILSRLSLLPSSFLFDLTSPSFNLPGRAEERTVDGRAIFLDGAHTPQSAEKLSTLIKLTPPGDRTLIFSTAGDKDWVRIGEILCPLFEHIIVTSTGRWKKSYPERIYSDLRKLFPSLSIKLILDYTEILDEAERNGGVIFVTGSFYLLAEIDEVLKDNS